MLIGGIALGLIAGFLAGGSLANLFANTRRLRLLSVLVLGAIVRFGTELALNNGIALAESIRLPLFAVAFSLLLVGCWANRHEPGFSLAFVGIASNLVPVLLNGGYMPIWTPSLLAAGFTPADVQTHFHTILPPGLDASFILRAGPLGDVIPIPLPIVQNVASIGDVFLASGLAFFGFASLVRGRARQPEPAADEAAAEGTADAWTGLTPSERPSASLTGLTGTARLPRTVDAAMQGLGVRAETGLAAGLAEASVLQRPLVLGGSKAGLSSPALAPLPGEFDALEAGGAARASAAAIARRAAPPRHHPYVRLALNGSFSALWVGQLISLFGDRIHQVALAFLVLNATHSPLPVALVFLAATLPNLLLGPVAGTFVDRWDHKEVMIVSDLVRAAIVLLIPVAAVTNLALVYPLVFLVTAVSLFFRPARTAVVPRIVARDELLTANSATWLGDTLADIVGYPLAGLFVAFLGSALPLAFWVDAGTYAASAVLIASMAVPALRRPAGRSGAPDFLGELKEGWRFLRGESVLLANTLQGAVGQFTVGVLLALTPIYATEIERGRIDASSAYGFLETAIGVGNLVGGVAIGLVGARLAKGRLVIVGYAVFGICTALLAVAGQLPLAIGLLVGSGIANMIYLIPSQTLFQERTPAELIGRVVGFRFSLVFGAMTLAMGVAGILATILGTAPVLGIFGVITAVAGLAGLLVPAVRDA